MTKADKELASMISRAFYEAENLGARGQLARAVELASIEERKHRAFGRRLVGDIGKRHSVRTCADFFALRGFLTPPRKRRFDLRSDFVAAFGAAAQVERSEDGKAKMRAFRAKWSKRINSIDYSRDMVRQ